MDKFTLFELHVHDGMEFSAMNTASPFGRSSDDEELDEELEEYLEEVDDERDDESESSGPSALPFILGLVVLAVVAVAVRKFRGSDTDLEIAELDDHTETYDEEEVEH